jgi:hypothetical protein
VSSTRYLVLDVLDDLKRDHRTSLDVGKALSLADVRRQLTAGMIQNAAYRLNVSLRSLTCLLREDRLAPGSFGSKASGSSFDLLRLGQTRSCRVWSLCHDCPASVDVR